MTEGSLLMCWNVPSHQRTYLFTIRTGNVDEQLLDTVAVRPWDTVQLNLASSCYRCDGAGLACDAQEDAELDPSEKL